MTHEKYVNEIVAKLMRELTTFTRELSMDDGCFCFELIHNKAPRGCVDYYPHSEFVIKFLGEEIWNSDYVITGSLEDYLRQQANRWLLTLSTMSF